MVIALYAFILVPVVLYLVFSVVEIWLTYLISARKHTRSLLFVQASTELTHTLLVFAYAQFMITFSGLLVSIGARLWYPIALLTVTILLRGSLYLLLFYREHAARWIYFALLITYLCGVVSLVWALAIVVPEIITTGFVPDSSNMPIMLIIGVPAIATIILPLIAVYRHAFAQLRG